MTGITGLKCYRIYRKVKEWIYVRCQGHGQGQCQGQCQGQGQGGQRQCQRHGQGQGQRQGQGHGQCQRQGHNIVVGILKKNYLKIFNVILKSVTWNSIKLEFP